MQTVSLLNLFLCWHQQQVRNWFFIFFSETLNDAIESNVEKEPERKPLPDLDKYWKAVNDEPSDFTGWTYLLQYVEQEVNYKMKNINNK